MKEARLIAVWNAVLPQDLWVRREVASTTREWIVREQRLVGRFIVPGMLSGACMVVIRHASFTSVVADMAAGVGLGLLAGMAVVAWRRRSGAS